jgi:Cd2+/Zn2+-exporting ATPase
MLFRSIGAGICVFIAVCAEYGVLSIPYVETLAALIALGLTAVPIIKQAVFGLIRREWNVCELAALALIAAVCIGEYTAAAEIAVILTIGELVEEYLCERAKKDLNEMVQTAPTTVQVMTDGQTQERRIDDIIAGDQILIRPGERIPVDGFVHEGQGDVDESFLTGESLPIHKKPKDRVYAGSINLESTLMLIASGTAQDSSYAQIVKLVKEAGLRRPPSHPLIDQCAQYYTPFILCIAGIVTLVTGEITRGISVLIVSCPCALLLATPSAVLAAIGPAAKRGILIKSGEFLEMCKRVTIIVFDKTGTLTSGKMHVTSIIPENGYSEEMILSLAASLERSSPHPIARAIVKEAEKRGIPFTHQDRTRHIPGKGIEDVKDGVPVLVGRREFLMERNISLPPEVLSEGGLTQHNETEVLVAENNRYIGRILISDTLHATTREALASLRTIGYQKYALITGDNENAANIVAQALEIPACRTFSGLLPAEKEQLISDLQKNGEVVCFVGDGTNDGPALTRADLGIGIGNRTHTLALESAGVILMEQGLSALSSFFVLGRMTSRKIAENIGIAILLNMFLMVMAADGRISPVMGAIGHQIATIGVLVNSIRLSALFPK